MSDGAGERERKSFGGSRQEVVTQRDGLFTDRLFICVLFIYLFIFIYIQSKATFSSSWHLLFLMPRGQKLGNGQIKILTASF